MAKITINPITTEFASVTAINNRLQQIADELNDNVLYRNNPIGEANHMSNDLDMNGNALLNIDAANSTIFGSSSLQTYIDYAEEWAINPEDSAVSSAAGGDGSTTFSSRHWAAKAEEWAINPEDSAVSTAAGGDGSSTFSALHWAAKSLFFKNGAETAQSEAEDAQAAAEDVYEDFNNYYLGSKSSPPTTNNSGAALSAADEGALYWNNVFGAMYLWTGSTWTLLAASPATNAADVSVVDLDGYYNSVNAEDAFNELKGAASYELIGDFQVGVDPDTDNVFFPFDGRNYSSVDLFLETVTDNSASTTQIIVRASYSDITTGYFDPLTGFSNALVADGGNGLVSGSAATLGSSSGMSGKLSINQLTGVPFLHGHVGYRQGVAPFELMGGTFVSIPDASPGAGAFTTSIGVSTSSGNNFGKGRIMLYGRRNKP